MNWCKFGWHTIQNVKYKHKTKFMGEEFLEDGDTIYKICTKCKQGYSYRPYNRTYTKLSSMQSHILEKNLVYEDGIPYLNAYNKRPDIAPSSLQIK